MVKEVKAATLTVTELVNATEVASIEQSNTNNMEKKEISENGNAANAASNELKSVRPPKLRKESILMIFWKMWRYTILNPLPTMHSI